MKGEQLNKVLDTLTLLVDTREHETAEYKRRLREIGLPHERQALSYGDYSAKCKLPNGEWYSLKDKFVIERKMSLEEVCGNFTTHRDRFKAEFERAKADGARVVILVENGSWTGIYTGRYSVKVRPASFIASILAFEARYNTHVHFVDKPLSPYLIRDILYYTMREHLLNLEVNDELQTLRSREAEASGEGPDPETV